MASSGYSAPYGHQPYAQGTYVATAEPYVGSTVQPVGVAQRVQPPGPQIIVITEQEVGLHPKPPSYCFSAWFSCIFCCWPIGLFAIYQSLRVDHLFSVRDYEGALRASERAKTASNVAILFGLIIILVGCISGVEIENTDANSAAGEPNEN